MCEIQLKIPSFSLVYFLGQFHRMLFVLFFYLSGVIGPILVNEIEKHVRQTNQIGKIHCLKISHIGTFSLIVSIC